MIKKCLFLLLTLCPILLKGQQYISSNHLWGSGLAEIGGFVADELQNTYLSGYFQNELIHNGQPIVSYAGDLDIFLTKYNDDQKEEWFVRIGGNGNDQGTALAIASDGNILIVGGCSADCIFGTTSGQPVTLNVPSTNGRDVFLAKYNSRTGELMWAKIIISGAGVQYANSLHVGSDGSILVGGGTAGAATFSPSTTNVLTTGMGYLAKFSSTGDYQWHTTISSSTAGTLFIGDITSQPGRYVFTGYTKGVTTFTDKKDTKNNIGPNTNNNTNNYMFVGAVDTDGNYVWLKNGASTLANVGSIITTGPNNTLYLTGYYSHSNFMYDGTPLDLPNSNQSIYLLTLDGTNGNLKHAFFYGSSGTDYPYGLQVKNNLLYLCGSIGASVNLSGKTIPAGMLVMAYTINNDESLTMVDALEGVKADNARGIVFSPKSFKLAGSFSGVDKTPMTIGDSIYVNSTPSTKDLYMSKACPIVGITPLVSDVSGCDAAAKNGSISLAVAGGAGPYTYQWEKNGSGILKGKTGASVSGLDTGRYTATVLFNNGYCSKSATVTVKAPHSLSIASLDITHASCDGSGNLSGGGTGSIKVNTVPAATSTMQFKATATLPGQTGPVYDVDWTANGGVFTGCPPGRYIISVRNNDESCPASKETIVAAIESPASISIADGQYTCNLLNRPDTAGMVKATVSGVDRTGQNVWFFLADAVTGATVQTTSRNQGTVSDNGSICEFDKVLPGKYKVSTGVIGNTSCMIESSEINIANPRAITVSSVKAADVLCAGTSTGRISTIAKGGQGSLTYTLLYDNNIPTGIAPDPRPTAVYFDNVADGWYTVVVSDDAGCADSVRNVQVESHHTPIVLTLGDTHDACFGEDNGSAKLIATGGVKPDEATTYTFTLTGGNDPYPNASGNFNKNLGAGKYTVTVTEHSTKCKVTEDDFVEIASLAAIDFGAGNVSKTDVPCYGDNTGTVTVSGVTGGTGKYTVTVAKKNGGAVSGVVSEAPYVVTGLAADDYEVTVSDDYGCSSPVSVEVHIAQPAEILFTISSSNVSCAGEATGNITVTVTGGKLGDPYSFELYESGNPVRPAQDSPSFDLLPAANNYVVHVTDGNGCVKTSSSISITQPTPLTYNKIHSDVTCFGGSDGYIEITSSGGTGTKTYFLTGANGGIIGSEHTTPIFTGLTAGIYKVRILLDGSCGTLTDAIEIAQPELLQIVSIAATPTSCRIPADGTATVTVTGGASPYTVKVDGAAPAGENSGVFTFTGLANSTHQVTVTDANGCSDAGEFTVEITPDPVIASIATTPTSCRIPADGTATVTVTDGASPYTVEVDAAGPASENSGVFTFAGLANSTHRVTVIDDNGCTAAGEFTVSITPNPLLTAVQTRLVRCDDATSGVITASATATEGGSSVFRYRIGAGGTLQASPELGNLATGDYTVTVVDGNACEASVDNVNVRIAANPAVSATGSDIQCYGGEGEIIASATAETDLDGTAGSIVSYQLFVGSDYQSDPRTSGTFTRLSAGSYSVHVKDSYGCVNQASATVAEPDGAISLIVTGYTDAFGSLRGSITVQPSRGWKQYKITCYRVTGGGEVEVGQQTGDDSKTYTFPNLEVSNYKIVAVDAKGCQTHQTQEIRMATGEIDLETSVLSIFPNPSSDGRFTIEWNSADDRRVTLEVYSISGKLVYKTNVQTGTGGARTPLDISNQSRGTYLLRVPELNVTQKLVVQ